MARQLFTRTFWVDAFERSVKTFAYSTLGALPVGAATQQITGLSLWAAFATGGSAALISLLGSVASLPIGNRGTASMTKAVEPTRLVPDAA